MGRRLRLVPPCFALLFGLFLWAPQVQASYQPLMLAQYSGVATESCIQSRGCASCEVAWRAPDGTIASRGIWSTALQPLVSHGAGKDPVMAIGLHGIYLAWATGNTIKVESSYYAWVPLATLSSGSGFAAHHPDFCASLNGGDPHIAWLEGPNVMFAEALPGGGWAAPEIVANDAVPYEWYGLQIETTSTGRPRVYYFAQNSYQPLYRERIGAGQWTNAIEFPIEQSDFAWPFRVVARGGFYGLHSILHVGMYRTCPCNDIIFTAETSDQQWSAPEYLTVEQDAYDWPKDLGLAASSDWSTYCVWYQESFDHTMALSSKNVFCRVKTASGWSTPSLPGLGVGHTPGISTGSCLDGLNEPELCWIEEAPPGTRVMVLHETSPGSAVPDARARIALSVAPNPSRGAFTIAWADMRPAKVDILGVDGRVIRSLWSESPVVWDRHDSGGNEVPAGAYWIRLRGASIDGTSRVIAIR